MGGGASSNRVFHRTANIALEVTSKHKSIQHNEVRVGSYSMGPIELGKGAFSVVRLGRFVGPPSSAGSKKSKLKKDLKDSPPSTAVGVEPDGHEVAIKCVDVSKLRPKDFESLADEVRILRRMNHPSIVCVEDVINHGNTFFIVMEKLDGGELFDRIVRKENYNEGEARMTTKILLEAVNYMHGLQIVHRDLKPENLLLKSEENDTDIKIADFGFATETGGFDCLRDICGSPAYVAPEVIMVGRGGPPYGVQCDMWSIGVIIFVLLGGYSPFGDGVQAHIFNRIIHAAYSFDPRYWDAISDEAKDLIRRMLVLDPHKRITAASALEHPWLKRKEEELQGNDLGVNLEELRKWNLRRKFRRVYQTVVACNKMKRLMDEQHNQMLGLMGVTAAAGSQPSHHAPPNDPSSNTSPAPPASDSLQVMHGSLETNPGGQAPS